MKKTFAKLELYMRDNRTHDIVPGRTSTYEVPDALRDGQSLLQDMYTSASSPTHDELWEDVGGDPKCDDETLDGDIVDLDET